MQAKAQVRGDKLSIPRAQSRAPPGSLAAIAAKSRARHEGMIAAYATGGYSYREIAQHFGVRPATVGRIVRRRTRASEN
jgi:putative transposase